MIIRGGRRSWVKGAGAFWRYFYTFVQPVAGIMWLKMSLTLRLIKTVRHYVDRPVASNYLKPSSSTKRIGVSERRSVLTPQYIWNSKILVVTTETNWRKTTCHSTDMLVDPSIFMLSYILNTP